MNLELEQINEENHRDKNINNLILITKLLSIISLFEYIGVLFNAIFYFFYIGINGRIQNIFTTDEIIEYASKLLNPSIMLAIVIFLIYIICTIINHRMQINKNHKLKKVLIIEIVFMIIFMLLPLLSLL